MGCKNVIHQGKMYFIPDCWGSVIHGKHACTCHDHQGYKLNDQELIQKLKEEIKILKNESKYTTRNCDNGSKKT